MAGWVKMVVFAAGRMVLFVTGRMDQDGDLYSWLAGSGR